MDAAWIRQAQQSEFFDATCYLKRIRKFERRIAVGQVGLPQDAPFGRGEKRQSELRQAALFLHGMSESTGIRISFSDQEDSDYDTVIQWQESESRHIGIVQLKQLPPQEVNEMASVNSIIKKLSKYSDSQGLVVALWLNRAFRFDPSAIEVPDLKISSLWAFGAANESQDSWLLWGDLLSDKCLATRFEYPV